MRTTSKSNSAAGDLNPGELAPEFILKDLSGVDRSLAEFNGKFVILNFWASWCAPCIDEMPELEQLQQEFKAKGLEVVSVAIDESKQEIERVSKELGISFPVLLDSKGEVKQAYKVKGFPETFVLDASSKFVLFPDPDTGMPELRLKGPRAWSSRRVKNLLLSLMSK